MSKNHFPLDDLVRWIVDEMNERYILQNNVIKFHQPLDGQAELFEEIDQYFDIECGEPINNIITISNNRDKSRVDVEITPYYTNEFYKIVNLKIRYTVCDDGLTIFDHDDIENVINHWSL